jgi:signal transduction histidine kinase
MQWRAEEANIMVNIESTENKGTSIKINTL